jgi:hypothetical protein
MVASGRDRLSEHHTHLTLAQLLRADLLPEAWIAPAPVRQLRALLRHRARLVRLGTPAAEPDPRGGRRSRL